MLPYLDSRSGKKKQQTVSFGGLNLTQSAKEGELRASKNLTTDQFPCLAVRRSNAVYGEHGNPTALTAWDGLVVVDGTDFIYRGQVVGKITEGEKQFAVVNTKLVIWPDKKYLDISDPDNPKWGYLDAQVQALENTVNFTDRSVTLSANPPIGEIFTRTGRPWSSPSEACIVANGQVIRAFEARAGMVVVPQYSESAGYYVQVLFSEGSNLPSPSDFDPPNSKGVYARIKSVNTWDDDFSQVSITEIVYILYDGTRTNDDLRKSFEVGDAVTISGCISITANNKSAVIRSVTSNALTFDAGTFTAGTESAAITIERTVPDLDYICSWKNRLCGVSNSLSNEIYDMQTGTKRTVKSRAIFVSALGSPANFNVFEGASTDSYSVAVASEGDFTGLCAYSDDLLIWKEDMLYKLIGDYPAEYALYPFNVAGVQKGSHKSMQIINEVLYYKGVEGVYAYAGNTPVLISYPLGLGGYSEAVAGRKDSKYYISMQDKNGAWGLYVYDTLHRIWLKETDARAIDFAENDNVLYYLDADKKAVIAAESGSDEKVEWTAELVEFNEVVLNKKLYTKLFLRVEMAAGSTLKVEVAVDDGPFKQVFLTRAEGHKTFTMPIVPRRCDRFRVRLSGAGFCMVKSMLREYKAVSER